MKPTTGEPDREGLLDYWSVYERHFEAIQEALAPVLAQHPVFGPILRTVTPEARQALNRSSLERMRRALVDGDGAPNDTYLREQGRFYATGAIAVADWYAVMDLFEAQLIPRLVEQFASEPDRLVGAIASMRASTHRSMAVITDEYLATRERAIDEQRSLAEARAAQLEQSEDSLRRQRGILESVLHSMRDGVVVADREGNVLMRSRAATATLAVAGETVSDRVTLRADESTAVPLADTPLWRALRGESVDDAEIYVTDATQSRGVHLSCDARPLLGRDGTLQGAMVVLRDITARREMDIARRRAAALEVENARIQEATRAKSQFLASMSHELRTPLNAIIGFSDLLESGMVELGSPDSKQFIADIHSSGRHLLRLVNDVLDLAKVEAGRFEFHPEPIELSTLIEDVCGTLRTMTAAKRVKLETRVASDLGEIVLDAARLKQVVYNYLSNALKFTPDTGRIEVRVTAEGPDAFRLEVQDEGPGVAPGKLSRLFQDFQQVHTPTADGPQGTGLGLALTRRMVEAQGGTVGVRSDVGKGSTFFAILPRCSAAMAEALPRTAVESGSASGPVVLVVEDDAADRDALADALGSAGYGVVAAPTGAEAIRLAQDRTFSAATIDLLLPDMSGLEVIRTLRGMEAHRKLPLIIVTLVAEANAMAGVPVTAVLQKPLDRQDLLRALADAGVTPLGNGPVLVVDDDPGSLRLMEAALQKLGAACVTAADGVAALGIVEDLAPSAIIVDLLMPRMDGFELIERLRRDPRYVRVPVLVWTSKDLSSSERERLRVQSQGILTKDGTGARAVVEHLRSLVVPS